MRPFQIHIPDEQLDDLRFRLKNTRWPGSIFQVGSEDGVQLSYVKELIDHWATDFDWRTQESRLNRLPQFLAHVDGYDIHFIHCKSKNPKSLPLIMTHGWPGSFIEFEQIIPRLIDPASHGGDSEDSFDVVIPSLPGFGFSSSPAEYGTSTKQIAGHWRTLMGQLGYDTFYAQGGDIGAGVSAWLAVLYPQAVKGVHLNYIPASFRPPLGEKFPPITKPEQKFLDEAANFAALEGAYAHLQSTKPQTLAYSLTDSPVGLASWISEKFESWVDHDGDLESIVPRDVLLTNISLYWFQNTIDASLRLYKENRLQPLIFASNRKIEVPIGVAKFPKEIPVPPRSWVERVFRVDRWSEMPKGGHFAALEQPDLLVEDIRGFFRPFRS